MKYFIRVKTKAGKWLNWKVINFAPKFPESATTHCTIDGKGCFINIPEIPNVQYYKEY